MKLFRILWTAAALMAVFTAVISAQTHGAVHIQRVQAGAGAVATPAVPVWRSANNFEFIAAGPAFGGEIVKGSPYSAEAVTETQQTLTDGNRIRRTNTSRIYRDSEGRTRREQQISALGPWSSAEEPREIVFIHDPVAGVHYVSNPSDRTARRMEIHAETGVHAIEDVEAEESEEHHRAGPNETAPTSRAYETLTFRRLHRETKEGEEGEHHNVTMVHSAAGLDIHLTDQNMSTESLGTRLIEGVEANGVRNTTTIPAGQIGNELPIEVVSESWYSPQLKTVVLSRHSDPRMGETTYRLTNIQLVEPLPTMFQVPADYTIVESPAATYIKRPLHVPGDTQTGPGR